jgi:hypothetical protein
VLVASEINWKSSFQRVHLQAFPRYDLLISPICSKCGSLQPGKISTQSNRNQNIDVIIEVALGPELSRKPDGNFFFYFAQMSVTRLLSSGKVSSTPMVQILRKVRKTVDIERVYIGPVPRYSLQVMPVCRGQRNLATDDTRTQSLQSFRR